MSSKHNISQKTIPIAAEDKFLIFAFGSGRAFAPDMEDAARVGAMVQDLCDDFADLTPIFDLRGLEGYYNDIHDFIKEVGGRNSYTLIGEKEIDAGWEFELSHRKLIPIRAKGPAFSTHVLNHHLFDANAEDYFESALGYVQNFEAAVEQSFDDQYDDFREFIVSIHRHSLLVELAMSLHSGQIQVAPYHSNAVHEIETCPNAVIVGRPAVVAKTTRSILSQEFERFQLLINDSNTRERHIQSFLEQHPNFLRGLNYEHIYPQLILERDDDRSLKPDFILEPYDDAFCDILEIKLPTQKVVVGRNDRSTLAAGLHQVAAQLREYAAYFENEKYRRFVHEKYGLRVYRPRLIAIVGRDMRQMSEVEFRRAMTVYDNLQFLTFDELLQHAKRRILF